MPFSFIEIEQQKSRKIILLFIVLVFFYFLSALFVVVAFKIGIFFEAVSHQRILFSGFTIWPSIPTIVITSAIAVIVAIIHWYFSTQNLIEKILTYLNAQPLDPQDTYHQRFKNVVEEVGTAIGGKKIETQVINSHALNAFALADFKGRAIIGGTEGLLVKLNRRQLEAVVGHEAGHIASGDCLATTISTSLFELHAQALKILRELSRGRNRGGLPILFLMVVLSITKTLTFMINMFISREKEYRSDAISSRLTRDPLSLAEALYLISTNWRGEGIAGDELSSIFIMSPRWNALEESEGFWANLFSTHPPVQKRMGVMLDMAHTDISALKNTKPDSLKQAEEIIVSQENLINKMFNQQLPTASGHYSCPKCHQGLIEVLYEGMPVWKCQFCQGYLVNQNRFPRILSREVMPLSPEIAKLAKAMRQSAAEKSYSAPMVNTPSQFFCPSCSKKMVRGFYPAIYPLKLELDQCPACQVIWFDKNELQLVQYFSQISA